MKIMSSISQFICGAAAGVAVVITVTRLRNYWTEPHNSTTAYHRTREFRIDVNDPEIISQDRVLHSIQSAATPMRATPDEPSEEDEEMSSKEQDCQSILNLLYNIAEDQAKKEGFAHRGITCNTCNCTPITGVRYKCANCVDYDICERCETQDCHNRTHVFLKITIPIPPLANPRTPCASVLYPGKKNHACQLTWDEIERIKNDTHFDQVEIEALVQQFKTLATEDLGITKDVFDQCLGPLGNHRNLVMEQMFKFYDQDDNNIIDIDEFIHALSILVKGTQEEKIPFAFKGYDIESKGYISKDNLRNMFKAYFNISLDLVRDVVKSCEEEMMASFDDTADKPVSAVFNAPIPNHGAPSTSSKPSRQFLYGNQSSSSQTKSDGMWPVMEAMSQDAIDEMVENVFKQADLDGNGQISFEEFRIYAASDSTLLTWFEALGTVF